MHLLEQFEFQHLPPTLQAVASPVHGLAHTLAAMLADGPELSDALRNLLRAKDSFVRQRVNDLKAAGAAPGANTPEPAIAQPRVEAPITVAQKADDEGINPR